MTDTALHLVERVLPEVRIRQWVCSLPFRLRALLGYDRGLCAEVLAAFVGEVTRSRRERAKERLGLRRAADAKPGAVTFIQRFDSGLRLNVHFHTLFLDGVYLRDSASGALVFHELPEPSDDEVAAVARRTAERIARLLVRAGRDAGDLATGGDPLAEQPTLALVYGAAAGGTDLDGERAGRPTLRLVDPDAARAPSGAADVAGVNIHARVVVDGRDRARLEHLCRYLARPPIAKERLELRADGRVVYTMKKPWRDGTRAVVMTPMDLIARLGAMVPPPGFHLTRFHGVLAAHAAARPDVVPTPPEDSAAPGRQLPLFTSSHGACADEPRGDPAKRKPWAWLLRHVFAVDVTVCPFCEGRMRWLEVATAPDAIAELLARVGHGPRPPPPRPSRAPRRRPRRRAPFGQLELDLRRG
jgi:Putative transposase